VAPFLILTFTAPPDGGYETLIALALSPDILVYLVNAHYLKSVHGRKSDVSDCQWIHISSLSPSSFRSYLNKAQSVASRKSVTERTFDSCRALGQTGSNPPWTKERRQAA